MRSEKQSTGRLLTLGVILGSLTIGVLLIAVTFLLIWRTRPTLILPEAVTPAIRVIPPLTLTPTAQSPPQNSAAAPTVTPPPPGSPDGIVVGDYVQVSGTGGDGLRLRVSAGLDSQIQLLGREGEIFQVRDGPLQADGHTWWYLVGASDESRSGWAVADYLISVDKP